MVGPPSDTRREGIVIRRAPGVIVSEVPVAQHTKEHHSPSTEAYSPWAPTGAELNRPLRAVSSAVALGQGALVAFEPVAIDTTPAVKSSSGFRALVLSAFHVRPEPRKDLGFATNPCQVKSIQWT